MYYTYIASFIYPIPYQAVTWIHYGVTLYHLLSFKNVLLLSGIDYHLRRKLKVS